MKKLMMIMIILASVTLTAQRGSRSGNDRMSKNLTAEQTATLQTKKMTLALALDENQSSKVYDLMLQEAKERKAKKAERKNNKEKTRPTKEERYAKVNKHLDDQIAMQNKMKKILTEEQFAKFEKTKMNRRMKGKHRGKWSKRSRR